MGANLHQTEDDNGCPKPGENGADKTGLLDARSETRAARLVAVRRSLALHALSSRKTASRRIGARLAASYATGQTRAHARGCGGTESVQRLATMVTALLHGESRIVAVAHCRCAQSTVFLTVYKVAGLLGISVICRLH